MTVTADAGPFIGFGQSPVAGQEYNQDRGPSMFDMGAALLDPRQGFTWNPGSQRAAIGWYGVNRICTVDAVPSTLAANNIVTSQVPVAGTALTLTAGTGVTGSSSVVNQATGQTVTGLLALDQAMGTVDAGGGGQVKLWDPTKALTRNVRITSVGNDTGATFVVRGYDLYGFPMAETITGANATVASGIKCFKYIASITPAGTLSGSAVTVGTGDVFGFPIRSDIFSSEEIWWNAALITASTGYTAAVTTNPNTVTLGDVRGKYNVQSASDNAKRLIVFQTPRVANVLAGAVGLFGVPWATA